MPGYDRSGPMGGGPMTGGMRGLCNPEVRNRASFSGGANVGVGRGMGLGRGFRGGMGQDMKGGFGRGDAGYPPTYTGPYADGSADELDGLKAQADSLRKSLDAISKRIEALGKSAE